MKSWNDTPFSELLIESRDGEWGKGEPEVGHLEAVLIRGTDFANINDPGLTLPHRWIKEHLVERKKLQAGDIVFEMAGGTSKQSTGRNAILKANFFNNHAPLPAVCASFSRHLRLDQSRFFPEFIYYLLQGLYRSGYMGVFHVQHTGVARFQYSSFKKHTVLKIPPIATQQKIAAILTAYDDLIETNKRRIALLEKMAEEIYREWFVRLRFPGYQNTKFVKGIPESWETKTIGELCSTVTDGSHASPAFVEDGKPMASVKDMHSNGFNLTSIKTISDSDFEKLKKGDCQPLKNDVLIAKDGSYLKHVFVWSGDYEIVILSSIAILRPNPGKIKPYFFSQVLKQDSTKSMMSGYVSGSALPRIILRDFKKMSLLIPVRDLVSRYEDLASTIFQQIHTLLKANENLTKTRDLLLPRLISGKLPVEHLDIQTPPSMTP
ncbi:MAG: restriction endonuclease subunit S [Geitlerinemataceae cyanobacterium]